MTELKKQAVNLDNADSLKQFRDRFHIPVDSDGKLKVYFCGNSLGLQPKSSRMYIEQEMLDWENLGVEGHFEAKNPWKYYHHFLTESLEKLIGAKPKETVGMGTLTDNLNLLLISFYRPEGKRKKIIIEKKAFPSDMYSVKSHVRLHGGDDADIIEIEPRKGENFFRTEDIIDTIDQVGEELATVLLPGVNYFTGEVFDMKEITKAAHRQCAFVGFDLAHAIGNITMELHDWGADFAVWCSYKYLNAGPGSTAGIFVHERHSNQKNIPRLEGWWGTKEETRFMMRPYFEPMEGAGAWQQSNPAILPMASLKASLDIFDEAGIDNLREKSKSMTGFLLKAIEAAHLDGVEVITPKEDDRRGAQLSIRVNGADKSLFNRLTEMGVVSDWREPDVIRIAPVPLYNSYMDCWEFASRLKSAIEH
ncbi:MAG: kynureninase [Candidatus Kapaibacteriales bacterium]